MAPSLSIRVKKFSIKDRYTLLNIFRDIYIKGLKAFTSFINFYIQHECKNIFDLKSLFYLIRYGYWSNSK